MTRLHVLTAVALAAALALPAQVLAAPPKGEPFSDEAVDKAIKSGVAYLWSKYKKEGWTKHGNPWPEGSEDPTKGFKPVGREAAPSNKNHSFGGYTALAVYTLLTCGESYEDPRIKHAIKWMKRRECYGTYALGVRMQVWSMLPKEIGRVMLKKDGARLIKSICKPKGRPSRDPDTLARYGTYAYRCTGRPGFGQDNSVTQFGVLGVWAAARKGLPVSAGYWQLVYKHFRLIQKADGGWSYANNSRAPAQEFRSSRTMTTAGLACLFITRDYLGRGANVGCGAKGEDPAITRGLAWLDKHFDVDKLNFYFLYGVERVGLASGYKYFGKKDWYKLGATALIQRQLPGGTWYYQMSDNCFALLFLARGRSPVMFNRLRYDGDWNNRPRALANVTGWVSGQFEREVNWQIINVDTEVSEWHDSQTLLISGSKAPKFDEKQLDKIRKFVHQGGTILSVVECGSKGRAFDQAMRKYYAELFGPRKLTPLSKEHPLYTVHFKLQGQTNIWAISNGVRILALHTTADIVLPWQMNKSVSKRKTFELGANINFFVNDRTMGRARATSAWPAASGATPSRTVAVARVKYDGNWEPEPLAWRRMKLIMANKWQTNIKLGAPVTWQELDAKQWPLAAVTGTGPLTLSGAEKGALKAYVQAGGTVLMDAAGGSEPFADSARELAQEMFGKDSVARLGAASPVYKMTGMEISSVKYRKGVAGGSTTPRLRAATVGGRAAVFISGDDLTTGLLGCPAYGCKGYAPDSAVKLVRNIVLYAAGVRPAKTSAK